MNSNAFKQGLVAPVAFVLALAFSVLPGLQLHALAEGLLLSSGSNVTIKATEDLDADELTAGEVVNFQVVRPVKVNGTVVVKANQTVQAKVASKKNNMIFGIPGKLVIDSFTTETTDGQTVVLTPKITQKGEDRYVLAWVGWLLIFFPIFVKGQDGKITGGTEFNLMTLEDVTVKL